MNKYNDIRLIGLVGKAGSGKDTLADEIASFGWEKVAFADSLKRLCMDYLGLSYEDAYTQEGKKRMNKDWGMTNREILQKVGTDAMRDGFDKDVWVKIAKLKIRRMLDEGRKVVVTDCRFDNEAQLIEDLGGIVAEVVRDDASSNLTASEKQHASEQPVDRKYVAFTVDNNRSKERLRETFNAQLALFSNQWSLILDKLTIAVETGGMDGGTASRILLELKKFLRIKPQAVFVVDGAVRLEWNGDGNAYIALGRDGIIYGGNPNGSEFKYGDLEGWSKAHEFIQQVIK